MWADNAPEPEEYVEEFIEMIPDGERQVAGIVSVMRELSNRDASSVDAVFLPYTLSLADKTGWHFVSFLC